MNLDTSSILTFWTMYNLIFFSSSSISTFFKLHLLSTKLRLSSLFCYWLGNIYIENICQDEKHYSISWIVWFFWFKIFILSKEFCDSFAICKTLPWWIRNFKLFVFETANKENEDDKKAFIAFFFKWKRRKSDVTTLHVLCCYHVTVFVSRSYEF